MVPREFFDSDFKIDPNLLRLSTTAEIMAQRERFGKYLDIVNSQLEMAISQNKTFFHSAFNNIESIKDNNREVSQKTKSIQDATKKLKAF